jgi:hypothetical protein
MTPRRSRLTGLHALEVTEFKIQRKVYRAGFSKVTGLKGANFIPVGM